jgi:RNA polymerase sigma factor (sigma-70 family)
VRNINDNDPADSQLWMAARDGDVGAFTALYRRHATAVLKYAWSMLGSQHGAEEALQDTFLTAWEKRATSRIVDDSLLPWLLTVCRNHSRNQLRRARKHRGVDAPAFEAIQDAPSDSLAWIRAELGRLSEVDRQLCQLCLLDGYTYAEAARSLGTTETAVGKRLQRLRARLAASTIGND